MNNEIEKRVDLLEFQVTFLKDENWEQFKTSIELLKANETLSAALFLLPIGNLSFWIAHLLFT